MEIRTGEEHQSFLVRGRSTDFSHQHRNIWNSDDVFLGITDRLSGQEDDRSLRNVRYRAIVVPRYVPVLQMLPVDINNEVKIH